MPATSRCLRLPYYWDEAGYYIPAAWDFFRTGSLIPITTLTNAHPPLPSIYLALWWKGCGYLSRSHARGRVDGGGIGAARQCGGWPCGSLACRRSPSGPYCSPGSIPSGLRKVRWPTPTFLRLPARSGEWSMRCRIAGATRGPRRSGFPRLRCQRKRPSQSR